MDPDVEGGVWKGAMRGAVVIALAEAGKTVVNQKSHFRDQPRDRSVDLSRSGRTENDGTSLETAIHIPIVKNERTYAQWYREELERLC